MSATVQKRNTKQKAALRAAFEAMGRPLSAEEALEAAAAEVPGLGIATVYRLIRAGLEEEWLKAVEIPGQAPRYELSGKDHHHHFQCRACDRVFELEGCPGDFKKLVPKGFTLEDHEIMLFGKCVECNG